MMHNLTGLHLGAEALLAEDLLALLHGVLEEGAVRQQLPGQGLVLLQQPEDGAQVLAAGLGAQDGALLSDPGLRLLHLLVEGPQLPGLLQLLVSLGRQLLQLLQAGGDVVYAVTDHLGVARLVPCRGVGGRGQYCCCIPDI